MTPESTKPPSLMSVVWPPAATALLLTLVLLVLGDIGLTALGSMRSQMRGDRIVDYQVDIVSRLSRIEGDTARIEVNTRPAAR